MIKLKPNQWDILKERLAAEHPPSVMLIRAKMREVLGCTVREHHEFIKLHEDWTEHGKGYYRHYICLDFYSDQLETWFRLKYADFLVDQKNQFVV